MTTNGHNAIAFENGAPVRSQDFDFGALDPEPDVEQPQFNAESVMNLVTIFGSKLGVRYFGKRFSRKLAALAWMLRPEHFEGRSLTSLARQLGVSKQCLSKYTAEASRIFEYRNRGQITHGSRWKKERQRQRGR